MLGKSASEKNALNLACLLIIGSYPIYLGNGWLVGWFYTYSVVAALIQQLYPVSRSLLPAEASILCTPHFALLKQGQLSPGVPPLPPAI
jgi:hypothetical protein